MIGNGLFVTAVICMVELASVRDLSAEPAGSGPESVVVTAPKATVAQIEKYVDDFAAASARIDKIARWETTACPLVFGPTDEQASYLTRRIRQVAADVGARRQASGKCPPNIFIVVTDEPQPVLDYIRDTYPRLLGRHYYSQRNSIAQMKNASRAWYDTDTLDADGYVHPDTGRRGQPVTGQSFASTGLAHFDGLSSLFRTVLIVVDFNKAKGNKVGPLSDYIAMLALAQMQSTDECQPVPTVMNLLASCGLAAKPTGLTDMDLAYLTGLYVGAGDRSFTSQKSEIKRQMSETIANAQAKPSR